ncbi:MAG TPA: hypothetical protein DIU15_18270 [Deltaproteobacteria bacterium]|nr:hypothetical protein [Deltaproteobacteria bacterium]HCP47992.1 hypothetical protein [Deltaproteobacteria bacterium]
MAGGRIAGDHRAVAADVWNELAGSSSPFVQWEWLRCLEESGSASLERGWSPAHLLLEHGGAPIGLCPLYVRDVSHGEFVSYLGMERAAHAAGIPTGPRAVVGVPHTPVVGPRLLVGGGGNGPGAKARRRQLGEALIEQARRLDWASVHVHFCSEQEATLLRSCGFVVRRSWQYLWTNKDYSSFEEFLACLRSKRRTMIRREMRALEDQGLRLGQQQGSEVGEAGFRDMARAYARTAQRHGDRRPRLNDRFFALLYEQFSSHIEFQVAEDRDGVVGRALSVRWGNSLYGRYWGCMRPQPFLHFNVAYYAGIASCIRGAVERYDPGQGGEYKWARGFEAVPVYSAHWYAAAGLHQAVEKWAERESQWVGRQMAGYGSRGAFRESGG